MIKAIIIDDESHAIEGLRYEIQQTSPMVEIIASTTNPLEGIEMIYNLNPNLVFLDIEMPTMNGFEVLKNLKGKIDFDVIFVTAYDQYAIKAFKFSAIDYLLKPVNGSDLQLAISNLTKRKYSFNHDHFTTLMTNLAKKGDQLDKIVLPTAQGLEFVEVKNIIRCESNSNYCKVFLIDGSSLFLAKTLKEIESLLFDYGFYRVHNSHLISMSHIARYKHLDGGVIELTDGSKIPISRNKKNDFLKRFRF